MMDISFLTPEHATVSLVVLVSLTWLVVAARRRRRAELLLGVPNASFPGRYLPLARGALLLGIASTLAFALATPVAIVKQPRMVRTDAEVYVLGDNSMSMLARSSLSEPTRWDRLVAVTKTLHAGLPNVKVGIACFTNRATIHLFPTADRDDFLNVIERSAAINNPYPKNLYGTNNGTITTPNTLLDIAGGNFFSKSAKKRVVVMITDGEFGSFSAKTIANVLKRNHIQLVLVHVWKSGEHIFLRMQGSKEYRADPGYRADPKSRAEMTRLGNATGAGLFTSDEGNAIVAAARSALGKGPMKNIGREQIFTSLSWWGWIGALLLSILYIGTLIRFRTFR